MVPRCTTTRIRGRKVGRAATSCGPYTVSDPINHIRFVDVRVAQRRAPDHQADPLGKDPDARRSCPGARLQDPYRYKLKLPQTGRLRVVASTPTGTERRSAAYR